jgi:sigma-B regulation protein RsbU (phosphoserine phosphatase)
MKNRGIALKLSLLVLTSVTLIFALVLSYNYVCSSRIIIKNLEKNAHDLTTATVNKIDRVLYSVEKIPRDLASVIENAPYTSAEDMIDLMFSVLGKNPEIYGMAIAFEPYAHDFSRERFAPYVFRSPDRSEVVYIPYEYFYWDWYQIPKRLGHAVWSEPYFDEGAGNIVMSTYSVPFYKIIDGERKFMGIITADISLPWLQEIVESIKIKQTGYGFLISKNGTFVTHPDERLIMNETIFSVAESLNDPRLRQIGRNMIQGKAGFVEVSGTWTGNAWLAYSPMPSNGWSLGVLFPKSELMADITELNRNMILISLAGFALILLVIILISRTITRPLRMLSSAAEEMATGNLEVHIPHPRSKDEVRKLADSFDYMKSSLKQYIHDLTETTAAKQKIESELKIAHDIQMGILPKIFPPFPDRPELDLYAILEPAKDVGGDLYDFFFIDDDHICFTIGDVSGKGVPAALFMAITRTLIKTRAVQGVSPDSVMTGVNKDLAMDNPSMMFVTLFFGILNIRTGKLTYSNGGHNLPYLVSAQGSFTALENTEGMILGVMEDAVFESKTLTLEKGDLVFLYTDGVSEAINQKEEMFSEKRLEDELRHCENLTVRQVIENIQSSVKAFTKGMEQFDDITMLSIEFHGV